MEEGVKGDTTSQVDDTSAQVSKTPFSSTELQSVNQSPNSESKKTSDEEKSSVGYDGSVHKVWENIHLDLTCVKYKGDEKENDGDEDEEDEELNKVVETIIMQTEEEPSDWEDSDSEGDNEGESSDNKETEEKTVDNPENKEKREFVLILSDEEGDEEAQMSDGHSNGKQDLEVKISDTKDASCEVKKGTPNKNEPNENKDISIKKQPDRSPDDKGKKKLGINESGALEIKRQSESLIKGEATKMSSAEQKEADSAHSSTQEKNQYQNLDSDDETGDLLIDEDNMDSDDDYANKDDIKTDGDETDKDCIKAKEDNHEAGRISDDEAEDSNKAEADSNKAEEDSNDAEAGSTEAEDSKEAKKGVNKAEEDSNETGADGIEAEDSSEGEEDSNKTADNSKEKDVINDAEKSNGTAEESNEEDSDEAEDDSKDDSDEAEEDSDEAEDSSKTSKDDIQVGKDSEGSSKDGDHVDKDIDEIEEDSSERHKDDVHMEHDSSDGDKNSISGNKTDGEDKEKTETMNDTDVDENSSSINIGNSSVKVGTTNSFHADDEKLLPVKDINHKVQEDEEGEVIVDDSKSGSVKSSDEMVDISSPLECTEENSGEKLARKRSATDDSFSAPGEQVEVKKVKLDIGAKPEDVKEEKFEPLQNGLSDSEDLDSVFKDQEKFLGSEMTLTSSMLEDIIVRKVFEHVVDNQKSCIAALRQKCLELEKVLDKWRRKSMQLQKQVGDVILEYHKQLAKASSRPKVSTRTVGVNVRMMQASTRTVGVNVRIMTDADQDDSSIRKNPILLTGSNSLHRNSTHISPGLAGKNVMPKRVVPVPLKGLTPGLGNNSVTITATSSDKNKLDKNASPVPMHLIANTATGSNSLSISSVSSSSLLNKSRIAPSIITKRPIAPATVPSTSAIVVLTTTNAVNSKSQISVIDLTKEDGDNSAAATNTAVVFSGSPSSTMSGLMQSQATLPRGTVALSTNPSGNIMSLPIMSSLSSLPSMVQIIPSATVNQPVGAGTSMRMARPAAPVMQSTLQQGSRVAYLLPQHSGALTVVPRVEGPGNQLTTVPQTVQSQGFVPGTRQQMPTILLRMNTSPSGPTTVQTQPAPPPTIPQTITAVPALAPPIPAISNVQTPAASETNQPVPSKSPSVAANSNTMVLSCVTNKHPAPLPPTPIYRENKSLKSLPPKPALKISKVTNGIVLSWNMTLNAVHADIVTYQLYAYQENTGPPSSTVWKKVGDVKALPLPMACTLTQFVEGHKYHFAVRAVDNHNRLGPFSDPASILLVGKSSESTK